MFLFFFSNNWLSCLFDLSWIGTMVKMDWNTTRTRASSSNCGVKICSKTPNDSFTTRDARWKAFFFFYFSNFIRLNGLIKLKTKYVIMNFQSYVRDYWIISWMWWNLCVIGLSQSICYIIIRLLLIIHVLSLSLMYYTTNSVMIFGNKNPPINSNEFNLFFFLN